MVNEAAWRIPADLCRKSTDPPWLRCPLMNVLNDLRLAVRQFRQRPRFALAIVSTLALAIGMNVAVFSVVDAVMFRALPFASPERIVWLASVRPDNPAAPFSLPEYIDYRSRTRTLSGIAAYANWSASLDMGGITERLQGARMSANTFEVLGMTAAAGRLFRDQDDDADAPGIAMLSYSLWQRQFGGSRDLVGRPLRINGQPLLVVGILPRHFPLPLQGIDVIVPLTPARDPNRFLRNSPNFLRMFGRLRDEVTREQAEAELTATCRSLREQFPKEYARKESVRAIPFQEALVGDLRRPMLLMLTAVVVVLATALANLVSLTLIRANDRRAEAAVRIALGASRLDLMRQLTSEAALLALAGGLAGALIAIWTTAVVVPLLPPSIPRLGEARVDGHVLLFALGLTLVATMLLSVAPLAALARRRAMEDLRLHSRGAVGDRWNHRARQTLVVGEIAIALLLLLATTILVKNIRQLRDVETGFDPSGVFQARVAVPPTYGTADALVQFQERLSERLAAVPGVRHVGLISVAPLSGLLRTVPFGVVGAPADDREFPSTNLRIITPGYLAAVGSRLLAGRPLLETDRGDSPPVALVSAALANKFLAPQPIGRRIVLNDNSKGPRPVEIVGVVENVRQAALDTPPTFDVYLPLRQIHPEGVGMLRENQFWMVRMATDPAAFRTRFVNELRGVDPDAAISSSGPLLTFVEGWLGPRRLNLALFGAFAITAVLLAIAGVHALVAYAVSQRRQEIGVRMAMGATPRHVHRMILGDAARLVGGGLGIGALLAAVAVPVVSHIADDASPDPGLSVASTIMLVVVAIGAAWMPARRATRIPPTMALRGD